MTRRARVAWIGVLFLLLGAAVFVGVVILSREPMPIDKPSLEVPKACRAVRIVSALIAQIEKPDAKRIVLIGKENLADYAPYFEHAGLPLATNETALTSTDIVFLTSPNAKDKCLSIVPGALYVMSINARNLLASDFKKILLQNQSKSNHLWMPGSADWILTSTTETNSISLEGMMDAFSREGVIDDLCIAQCDGLADVFASYVGTLEDILPAFASGQDALVRPDNFVTREIPSINWLDASMIEEDIRKTILADIRSAQVVRRVMLEGMSAAEAGQEDAAVAAFARVALRNPRDTMLVERVTHLRVNAQTFEKVGNDTLAAHCYETIAQIYPNDPAPVQAFERCVERLGKKDLARAAHERARKLTRALRGRAQDK